MKHVLEIRTMKQPLFTLSLALLAGAAWAVPSQDTLSKLQTKLESIDSRRGLQIEGNIKSVYARSAFTSPGDSAGYTTTPDNERIGFTQLDLSLGFRPWETSRATVIMRMAAGYQDFFNAGAKTVSIPWMNLEGQGSENFYWVVGDFRQQYSPLTLNSPDVEIMYEPEIFRRNRYMARDQVYLQGNQRNLQGANLQFRKDFGGIIGEARMEGVFSRLRRIEVLDSTGAVGNLFPSSQSVPGASQSSGMDKYLYMANLEWLPFEKSAIIGVTPIFIQDVKSSNTMLYVKGSDPATGADVWNLTPVNSGVRVAENTSVLSVRAGFDGSHFMKMDSSLTADVVVEYAQSKDAGWMLLPDGVNWVPHDYKGKALLAQLNAGYAMKGTFYSLLSVDYLNNDTNWYNPLAQSPAFFARRILNSDKDAGQMRLGSKSPYYSTFDALYYYTPKFVPAGAVLVADPTLADQTESYNIAPMFKNSYSTAVYTRDELNLVNRLNDQDLTTILPNGLATANRKGFQLALSGGVGQDSFVEVKAIYGSFEEASPIILGLDPTKYSEVGGGLSANVGNLVGWGLPLQFSGSFVQNTAEFASSKLVSSFINSGFYGRFHKRFGVAFGIQMINSELSFNADPGAFLLLTKSEQMQWKAGLDYSLAKNTWLAVNYGMITVKNTYTSTAAVGASVIGVALPEYITDDLTAHPEKYATGNSLVHQFDRNILEATINADF